jgi:hypothetical protein
MNSKKNAKKSMIKEGKSFSRRSKNMKNLLISLRIIFPFNKSLRILKRINKGNCYLLGHIWPKKQHIGKKK